MNSRRQFIAILPFAGMRTLSLQSDPNIASRPFDAARDGFVGTGGATVVVLETEDEVIRRGVKPYAELIGWGQASDGHNVAISHPDGHGLLAAMRNALRHAGAAVTDIDYVNAHGTSTPVGDPSEIRVIKLALGEEKAARTMVSSTKSMHGHTLGAAGGLEAALTALAVRDGIVPPTINLHNPDPECDLDYVPNTARSMSIDVAVSNSFGFGGTNGTLVFRKFQG